LWSALRSALRSALLISRATCIHVIHVIRMHMTDADRAFRAQAGRQGDVPMCCACMLRQSRCVPHAVCGCPAAPKKDEKGRVA
jgi:hypothetical protein